MSIARQSLAVTSLVATAALTAVASPSPALAADHTVLLQTNAPVAGSDFTLAPLDEALSLQLNDAGQFAFHIHSLASYNGTTDRDEGVIRGTLANPSAITLAGRTGQIIDGKTFVEMNQHVRLNNAGGLLWSFDVAYNSVPVNHYPETIVYNGSVVVKHGDTIDGRTYSGSLSESLWLSQGGKRAHFLWLPTPPDATSDFPFNEQMVLISNGVALKRGGAGNSTLAGQAFHGFGQDSLVVANDAGKIAVTAWISEPFDTGLYVIQGATENRIARDGGSFAGPGPYNGWTTDVAEQLAINEAGDVVYQLYLENPADEDQFGSVIMKNTSIVATSGGPPLAGGMTVTEVEGFALNEAGDVAYGFYFPFGGDDYGGNGIAVGNLPVAYTGLVVGGKTIEWVEPSFDLNDVNQLLYAATFTDGTSALIVTTVPEPTALAALALAAPAGLLLRRRRRGR